MMRHVVIGTLAMSLAACGGGGKKAGEDDGAPSAAALCSQLSPAEVSAALNGKLDKAEPSEIKSNEGEVVHSNCTFHMADGRDVFLGAGAATRGDERTEADRSRKQVDDAAGAASVDVPGLGAASFWSEKTQTLWVYTGKGGYFTIGSMQFGSGTGPKLPVDRLKQDSIALARKLIG